MSKQVEQLTRASACWRQPGSWSASAAWRGDAGRIRSYRWCHPSVGLFAFRSRAGLLIEMVRHRDRTSATVRRMLAAAEEAHPSQALAALSGSGSVTSLPSCPWLAPLGRATSKRC